MERRLGVGFVPARFEAFPCSESSCEVAGAEESSGRGALVVVCLCPSWSPATTPLRHYALLSVFGTTQHVKNLYDELAKAVIAWTERHNLCFTTSALWPPQ